MDILILFYNTMWGFSLEFRKEDLPEGCVITTDRNLLSKADAVVFHLPDLPSVMEDEIDKREGQIWVGWNLECEENYSWTKDPEFRESFDLWMGYHQEDDIVYPYYEPDYGKMLVAARRKKPYKKACMFISSDMNRSHRQEYLKQLMQYTDIDSYGKLYHNCELPVEDRGRDTLLSVIGDYQFVISFENAIGKDYVTEKFFNPLLAGTVPVYLGAPNIREFAPGENCFLDVSAFDSPEGVAVFMNQCYDDEALYERFHAWRKRPLLLSFTNKLEQVRSNPLTRLCQKIHELKLRGI